MTAQTEFQAFLDAQKDAAYDFAGMTETEKQTEMETYTQLKIAVAQEEAKIAAFEVAKEAAFTALAAEHDAAIQALATTWQTAEDNDYTIPE